MEAGAQKKRKTLNPCISGERGRGRNTLRVKERRTEDRRGEQRRAYMHIFIKKHRDQVKNDRNVFRNVHKSL